VAAVPNILNYKGFYSIVLMALVDADYKFIWADVGGTGLASDAQIYNNSKLKECVENGSLSFSESEPLPPKGRCSTLDIRET